jgi:predicted MFS family arabinose efflux permease
MSTVSDKVNSPVYDAARVFVLLSGNALGVMVQLAMFPSLTQMANRFSDTGPGAFDGASIAQLVMTISAVTMVIGFPLSGWLAGLVGKRPVFLWSALFYAIFGVAGAVAPDLWTLLASRLLLGFAAAGLGTTAVSFLGDYYAREKRDRLIGWNGFMAGAVALVTLLAAGKLAEIDWRAPFGLYFVGLLVLAVGKSVLTETKSASLETAISQGRSVRNASGLFLITLLGGIVVFMPTVQGPFLLAFKGENSPSIQAVIGVLSMLGAMLGAYLFGFLRPRMSLGVMLAIVLAALGVGTIGLGVSLGIISWAAFAGLGGFGSGLLAPLMQSAIFNAVPIAAATRAMGITLGCLFLPQFLNAFLMTPLRATFGIEGTFILVGGLTLAGAVVAVLWSIRGRLRAAPSV